MTLKVEEAGAVLQVADGPFDGTGRPLGGIRHQINQLRKSNNRLRRTVNVNGEETFIIVGGRAVRKKESAVVKLISGAERRHPLPPFKMADQAVERDDNEDR